MGSAVVMVADPKIERGRFRVYTRVDGKSAVVDPSLPPGKQDVAVYPLQVDAIRTAERLAAGVPL